MLKNNSGFTVIELLVSFIIVMTISLGLFSSVDNYRERQQKELAKKEVNSYRNEIIKTIQDDIVKNRLTSINGVSINGCSQSIVLTFDRLEDSNEKKALCMSESQIEYGNYDEVNNSVDGIVYKVPSDFMRFLNKIIYYDTGSTSYGKLTVYADGYKKDLTRKIYSINLELEHTELDEEFSINIVIPIQSIESSSECYTVDDTGTITGYACPIVDNTLKIPAKLYDKDITDIDLSIFDDKGDVTIDLSEHECISGIDSGDHITSTGTLTVNYGDKTCP